jgi:hypothetical protein
MPMGIGPGLSVTRFESGIPGWMTGMDLGWDFTQNVQYSGATNPTDTHSATIYAQSSSGVWQAIPANVLTQTDLGLQTVPTRTNSIRNNSMSGAVAGSPGTPPTNWTASAQTGYAWQLVATGTEFGLPYIDYRLSGTDALLRANNIIFENGTTIVAATAETWSHSVFARVVAGSLTGVTATLQMDENTSGGAFVTNGSTTVTPTASFARYSFTRTLSGGATVARVQPFMRFTTGAGATVDVTIRIYAPQMELGAFPSPPILTTSGAATVNGNQQVVDLTGRLSAGVGVIAQFNVFDNASSFKVPLSFNDGGGNNIAVLYVNTGGGNSVWVGYTGGALQFSVNLGTMPTGLVTVALVLSENYATGRIIGNTVATVDATVLYPPITRLSIGGVGYGTNDNNYQQARRMALKFGAQNAATFADLVAKATILAAVS